MVGKLANIIAERIVEYNHRNEEKEIYNYGLQIMLNTLCSICMVLVLGGLFHEFFGSVFFLICYCSVRFFAGGLHVSTNGKCMTIFVSGYLAAHLILKRAEILMDVKTICFLLLFNCLILLLAPVDVVNNPISIDKKRIMKRKAFLMSLIITLVILLMLNYKPEIGEWAFAGLSWICLILVAGKFNNILVCRRYLCEKTQ